jgi:hypothetical protein
MQDLPENTALLASVEAFLKKEVMPQLDPSGAFRARVSANVLGMVRRHLEQAGRAPWQDRPRSYAGLLLMALSPRTTPG